MTRTVRGAGLLIAPLLLGLTGCGVFADPVTDCDMSGNPVTCQRDERFDLAGTSLVVEETETITEVGGDAQEQARVEARITLDAAPRGDLRAQLHVVDPLTEEPLVVDADRDTLAAGEQNVAWDFSGHGFAPRIQFDRFTPDVFIVFDDGAHEVTVNVIRVTSWEDDDA